MADEHDPDISTTTEIRAALKPIAPWWQWIIGLMFFSAGVGGFSVIPDSLWSVAFSILLLVGVAAVLAYFLRNKTVSVTLMPGDDCVFMKDPARPGLARLVALRALRVEQEDDRRIRVERDGRMWELKRMELRFANPEDTAKAICMLGRWRARRTPTKGKY